jgi:NADPH:quinone reductase-like Zn-dependent oxidoreductase
MIASIRRRYGTADQLKLEQIEKPTPKQDEVLIKVHATTVNRTDCANLCAKPFIMRFVLGLLKPRKIIVGTDFAGEVVGIGSNVNTLAIGDKVFGFNDTGSESQAEYLAIAAKHVYPIPKNSNYKMAAASLEGAHYAYAFLHKVTIKPGQHILINGATGAIGSALLQFVRQYDVLITATCNSQNTARIKALGADSIIDYTKEDFTKKDGSYAIIFDTVGKSTFGKCKPILEKNGVYISSELGPYAQNVFYPLFNSVARKKVIFPAPYPTRKSIPFISKQLDNETFKPVIDREYQLEEISEAYAYVVQGMKTGNVIINI